MATILTKKSDTASAVPLAADLTNAAGGAELAVNATDKRLFSKTSGGTVVELGTNPTAMAVVGNTTVGGTLGVTGATTLAGVSATTLSASSTVTLSGGTANGVAYLNGSKVVTSGSALTFDGTNLSASGYVKAGTFSAITGALTAFVSSSGGIYSYYTGGSGYIASYSDNSATFSPLVFDGSYLAWRPAGSEGMRLTSTGLGIGTSSPDVFSLGGQNLTVRGAFTRARLNLNNSDSTSVGAVAGTITWGQGTTPYASIDGLSVGTVNSGALVFNTATSGTQAERMRLDSSGNLLVGTTTAPSGASIGLSVVKGGGIQFGGATGGGGALVGNSGGGIQFYGYAGNQGAENYSERMRLDSSGNLGLGVTPSAWRTSEYKAVQVGIGASFYGRVTAGDEDKAGFSANAFYDQTDNRWEYIATDSASRYDQTGGGHYWYSAASGTAGNAITFTQAMTLTAGGKLFVNTTSGFIGVSNVKVDVGGRYNSGISGVGSYSFGAADGGGAFVINDTSNGSTEVERMRINSSGNLLVGTTDSGFTTGSGFKFGVGTTGVSSEVGASSSNGDITKRVYSTGAGAYRFYVGYGGTVYATSTSISAISDATLKENVRDLETGLTEVMALKPRRFDWKNGDAQNVAGFIAQEVEQVLPELITDYQYSEGVTKKSLKMGDILPTLVNAIQEQQAIINSLKARLDAANL